MFHLFNVPYHFYHIHSVVSYSGVRFCENYISKEKKSDCQPRNPATVYIMYCSIFVRLVFHLFNVSYHFYDIHIVVSYSGVLFCENYISKVRKRVTLSGALVPIRLFAIELMLLGSRISGFDAT